MIAATGTPPRTAGAAALVVLLCLALFPLAPTARAEPGAELPATVPSVRDWSPGAGRFVLASEARIATNDRAAPVARRLAEDLARRARLAPTVTTAPPSTGDIVLRIDDAAPAAPESYRIEIADTISASARTRAGLAHAAQTLLQWLSGTTELPRGVVEDRPDYPDRGLLLDVGRQFMTVDWIKQRIREMAYYRMNLLHLHLSDVGGFRLASTTHPEITSPQHYSRRDIDEIVSYAAEYGVEVLPEIGFPAHMNAILAPHPELKLRPARTSAADAAADALLAGSTEGRLDLSRPESYELVEDLLREFVPQFPGRSFHIGGDEYVNDYARYPQLTDHARSTLGPEFTGEDLTANFFNWAAGIVRSYGKSARMWNDGLPHGARIPVDPAITVEYWTGGSLLPWVGGAQTPERLADDGHSIVNAAFTPTYYATGGYARPLNSPPELLYAWDPTVFVTGARLRPDQHSRLRGAKLHIFCDDPTAMTEQQITAPLRERLPILAQRLWSGTSGTDYRAFTAGVRATGLPPY
ncbi:family 20 glycosylhydrolase [Nocardia wallacei]|uniref:family 20 glycosylhydrolase n=1 Tax=Nocardia wallacei TaxID=480035 RepID=UPI00245559BA|nr:family 20 glycosylhydrolase [Nocardia wallacei]